MCVHDSCYVGVFMHLNYDIPVWYFVAPLLLSYHLIHYLFILCSVLEKGVVHTHNDSYNTTGVIPGTWH